MNLFNYITDEDKDKIKKEQQLIIDKTKIKLKEQGMNDYLIERKIEEIFCAPDVLMNYGSNGVDMFESVTFYFDEKEFDLFTKVFKVSRYLNVNCNQTWILLEFVRLIQENKIILNFKSKKVDINDKR